MKEANSKSQTMIYKYTFCESLPFNTLMLPFVNMIILEEFVSRYRNIIKKIGYRINNIEQVGISSLNKFTI